MDEEEEEVEDVDADDEWEWIGDAREHPLFELEWAAEMFLLTSLVMNRAAASISPLIIVKEMLCYLFGLGWRCCLSPEVLYNCLEFGLDERGREERTGWRVVFGWTRFKMICVYFTK